MGLLDDITTIMRTASSATNIADKAKHKSFARGSLDGTMQFPCLISDDIPIEMAATIARTLERVYASFVQSYLSLNNTVNIAVDKNPLMYMKRFHHNIKLESTAEDLYQEYCIENDDEYNKLMERIYNGTTKAYINESAKKMILFNFSDEFNKDVFESNKELLEESLSSIDFTPFPNVGNSPFYEALYPPNSNNASYINMDDYSKSFGNTVGNIEGEIAAKSHNQDRLSELEYNLAYNRSYAQQQARRDVDDIYADEDDERALRNYRNQQQARRDLDDKYAAKDDERALRNYRNQQSINSFYNTRDYMTKKVIDDIMDDTIDKYKAKKEIDSLYAIKDNRAKEDYQQKNRKEMEQFKQRMGSNMKSPSLLKDTDIKKSNDLQPYMMEIRLMAVNDKNEFVQFMDFIMGVKVVLHNIKSDEMILNIQNALRNNGKLFNFIRWTTGEKSLVKDLLLHINDTKFDIANKSKGSSPWWSTLKRMKDRSRVQSSLLSKNQIVPNSTIVISSYDLDVIQKNYGYNLKDYKIAKKLMDVLFLMNLVIVNDGTRTIDVLYDGERSYQTYALETLEREVSMNSNKIGKELTRMISR